jgi:hypothetical protein
MAEVKDARYAVWKALHEWIKAQPGGARQMEIEQHYAHINNSKRTSAATILTSMERYGLILQEDSYGRIGVPEWAK